MSESTERERPELLPCPWCDEQDFDLIGLKSHVLRGDCVQFDGTPGVAFVTRRSEGPAGAYEHPEHGLTCPIGGCSLRVEGSGDGTCYYVPTPPELARGSGDLQRREAPDSPEGGTGPASAATAAPELDRCADGDGDVSRDAPIRPRVGGSSRGEDDPRAASSAPAPERRSGKDRRVENGGWASRPSRSGIDRRASQQAKDGAEVPEVNNGLGDPDRPLGAPDASDVDLAGSPDTSVKEASPANGDAGSVARSQTLEPRGGRYGWENRMGPPPKRAALDRPRVEEREEGVGG